MEKQKLNLGDKLYKHHAYSTNRNVYSYVVVEVINDHDTVASCDIQYLLECIEEPGDACVFIDYNFDYLEIKFDPDFNGDKNFFYNLFAAVEKFCEYYRTTAEEAWLDYYMHQNGILRNGICEIERQLGHEKDKLTKNMEYMEKLRQALTKI